LQEDFNNNNIERLNREIRDRGRVMKTLQRADTPILSPTSGMRIFTDYIKPYQALEGNTPAEVAGIKSEIRNKMAHSERAEKET